MRPIDVIKEFDQFLDARNLKFEAIAIGGTALNLMGVVTRETRDCDILSPTIPAVILDAAKEFAVQSSHELKTDWLNNGPSSLAPNLPSAWQSRTVLVFEGKSLTLHTLGRSDLLKTKLFALCDRETDLSDCIAMKPAREELRDSLEWIISQDTNPMWPNRVKSVFAILAKRLGYEF